MRISVAAAIVSALPLVSTPVFATDFKCGKDFVTFQTTGDTKTGPTKVVTIQKRLIMIVVETSKGETAVILGRDGVPETGANYISTDTYLRFLRCLD